MLTLIPEIGLTIWAWKRGWKGWALLPLGIGYPAAFCMGFIMGAMGFSENDVIVPALLLEGLIFAALIFMVARGRKKEEPIVYIAPAAYNVPAAPPATPPALPCNQPVKDASVNSIYPPTTLAPAARARLVLPDNSEIAIKEPVRLIGRTDLEKTVPPDNLQYISRQHIMIRSDGSRYYVEDRASANSTKVNGINIKGLGKHELLDGDKIDLADAVALTFKVSSAF